MGSGSLCCFSLTVFHSLGELKPSRVVFSLGNCLTLPDNTRHQPFTGNTENTPCRKAAREMDENMLYWKRGARSRDGLLL